MLLVGGIKYQGESLLVVPVLYWLEDTFTSNMENLLALYVLLKTRGSWPLHSFMCLERLHTIKQAVIRPSNARQLQN